MPPEYFFMQRENMPCIYELSWDKTKPAVIVRAHKEFLANCPELEDAPIKQSFMEAFHFSRFESDIRNGNFGFEGVFERVAEEDGFATFRVAIPKAKKQLYKICPICHGDKASLFGKCLNCNGRGKIEELCSECHGAKKNEDGDACPYCEGRGKKTYIDWDSFYAISASFNIFFNIAALQLEKDKATSCQFPQLIFVNIATDRDIHGGSLDGTYSIPLASWLSCFESGTEITEMTGAMILAWTKIYGVIDKYDRNEFYSKVAYKNGWLNVSCPGNRCGLHPANNWGPEVNIGYEFSCHNVDTPMQQITIIAGLAALCDKAKKEIMG